MLTGVELLNNSFHCTKKTERVASFSYMHVHYLVELVSGPSASKFFTFLEIEIIFQFKNVTLGYHAFTLGGYFPLTGTDMSFNRSSRRKRGMASNPLFIIPDFFLHVPNELCYGYLRFEGNGKAIAEFFWKMQRKP